MDDYKSLLGKLISGQDLTQQESYSLMDKIAKGSLTSSQIAGVLVALRAKGETTNEISGFALAMRDAALKPALKTDDYIDCCGTGGDEKGGLNISTAVAFVAAGAGYKVAKHGNRSISSKCGSADVLELMGVKLDPALAQIEHSLNNCGIGFLFAPVFHPGMKHAMPARRELGIKTIFNLLGPLTNPAMVKVQLIGVYDPALTVPIAQVLAKMKHKAGLVVHSNGWDEITLDGKIKVSEMTKGKIRNYYWTHKDFGLPKVSAKELKGGDSKTNADILFQLLEGKKIPLRHVVVANAAALIYIAEKGLFGKTIPLKEAVRKAEESLDSNRAFEKFKMMAQVSHVLQ